ncbi:histidine kinase [Fibrisoma limi BUZ 3]|uniref:histidine kinase n=1 Tax=Fibrisoma limi BUZ 3 TaxID=1185876 RepID=I2GKW9_9BACT|nr:ATP-binding protein [Fibrisoma limi]CCH54545.1 histidine kinase [Fibrisoma limi BUZ 3]
MSIGSFLIAFFLIRHLRKFAQNAGLPPMWEQILLRAQYVAIGLMVVDAVFDKEQLSKWAWHLFLLGLLWLIYPRSEFRPTRNFVSAVLPLVLINIVVDFTELVASTFARQYNNYFEMAQILAFGWVIAAWVSTQRQQKALEKERQKRLEEEERNRLIAAQNTQLESMVAERTAELVRQKEELEETLTELRATQAQLIQQEKMASLGELTAGIAHEIQNPLNFVNNFAEVSVELCQELNEELAKVDLPESDRDYVGGIISDLVQNQQKIAHHGKRADSIVKGMLQHSRAGSGRKEPTDLNALADEYLRLAYHGLRAKDKNFNASLITNLSEQVGKVDVLPQDMGRVLLNLFTNAFYAVQQKQKLNGDAQYQPTVTVSTKRCDEEVEIRVRDNGVGIPESVRSKIFQPFFTTKPTGEGTGLGLSLAFDIITKGHGGTMEVETEEGKGTEFIIRVPV